jgi:hypothetical protein
MRDEVIRHREDYLTNDSLFTELHPYSVSLMAGRHWTPFHIVKQVIDFLGVPGSRVLDIGSGAGKFCLLAAYCAPDVELIGVEQRSNLVRSAIRVRKALELPNVSFINANVVDLDLKEYDHFYFYNSFYENIEDEDRIDCHIPYSEDLYNYYVSYLHKELQRLPIGTRIATYHSGDVEIPPCYQPLQSLADSDLKFWIRR